MAWKPHPCNVMQATYFPVGITPTKPLTSTHVRGLLHLDALVRLHKKVHAVSLAHNRRLWDLSQQTLGFWDYLNQVKGDELDVDKTSENEIGLLYLEYARSGYQASTSRLSALWGAVRDDGYVHPLSAALLRYWIPQLEFIGVDSHSLLHGASPASSIDELTAELKYCDMLLDHRSMGGALYVDQTAYGVAPRTLISAEGLPNYLLGLLCDALHIARSGNPIFLFHDSSVERDFIIIEKFLIARGSCVKRINFPRVTIEGKPLSFREGGGLYTLSEILMRYKNGFDRREIRLALRIFFLHRQGIKKAFDFDWSALDQCMDQAKEVIRQIEDGCLEASAIDGDPWSTLMKNDGTMNVYEAITRILKKDANPSVRKMLLECMVQ